MIQFLLLVSRQGKLRLAKWYSQYGQSEKQKIAREVSSVVLNRLAKLSNFYEWRENKIVYKRYASLFFIACVNRDDNELGTLELIHHYVEILDRYFGNVCELDLIYHFHKAHHLLDEVIIAGHIQESSKRNVLRAVGTEDAYVDEEKKERKGLLGQFADPGL